MFQYKKYRNSCFLNFRVLEYVAWNNCYIATDQYKHQLKLVDPFTFEQLASVGEIGTKLGQFYSPSSLCIQPITNHLLVCDTCNNRVQVLSLHDSLTPLPLFAVGQKPVYRYHSDIQPSEKKGEFNSPEGVCCSPNGEFFISDHRNYRVQSFDCSGRFLSTFGSRGVSEEQFYGIDKLCFIHPQFSPSSVASGILCVNNLGNSEISFWGVGSTASSFPPQHLFNLRVRNIRCCCVDQRGFLYVSFNKTNFVDIFDLRMINDKKENSFTFQPNKTKQLDSRPIQVLGQDKNFGSGPEKFYDLSSLHVDNKNVLSVVDAGHTKIHFFEE